MMKFFFVKSCLVVEEGWEGGYIVLDELEIYFFMLNVGFFFVIVLVIWFCEFDFLN